MVISRANYGDSNVLWGILYFPPWLLKWLLLLLLLYLKTALKSCEHVGRFSSNLYQVFQAESALSVCGGGLAVPLKVKIKIAVRISFISQHRPAL